jgi:hypothetical protein
MAGRLGILRVGERSARAIAAHSRSALDRPLREPGELWIAVADGDARVLGAFQRAPSTATETRERRGSGGPEVRVGPGTIHMALALAHPGALVAADEKRIVNRCVRPLLKALTRVGALAHFFGRDWVSVQHRPAAWVGFAHDATTRRTLFEAFVALRVPFHDAERPSFLGKEPTTLEEILRAPVDPARVVGAIVDAYAAAWSVETVVLDEPAPSPEFSAAAEPIRQHADEPASPPWAATVEEAIGVVGAGPDATGAFRVGGDLLVSRDALARLEAALPAVPDDAVGQLVDDTLGAPGVALDGVRSLTSVRDVIVEARRAPRPSRP